MIESPKFDALRTEELLVHVRQGNQDAWREVYRRYRSFLASSAKRVAGAPLDDAEDVLQSAFLTAWKDIESFDYRGQGSLRAWMEKIVIHKNLSAIRTRLRRSDRLKPVPLDTAWLDHAENPRAENPEKPMLVSDEQRRLFDCMEENLDDLSREIIVLRHLEGLSTRQIADVTELPAEQVRRRYRTAMTKIARVLGRGDVHGT